MAEFYLNYSELGSYNLLQNLVFIPGEKKIVKIDTVKSHK